MRDNFIKALTIERSKNENIMLLTGDLGFGVLEDFEIQFPSSFLNLGIAEQTMTGIAAGLALSGKKVFTYSIGNFPTLRCLEQIRNDIAYHNCDTTIVSIGGGFSYGQLGMSHHATEDLGVMRSLPNIKVLVPCTNNETEQITKKIVESTTPNYLRLDKSSGYETIETEEFNFGKLRKFKPGDKYVIIATGGIIEEAIKASETLKSKFDINLKVLGCHMIKPFDEKNLLERIKGAEIIITLEEHNIVGGLGSLVAETLFKHSKDIKHFINLGIQDVYSEIVGDQNYLRKEYKIDESVIIEKLLNSINDEK